jgi:hypothetical protein
MSHSRLSPSSAERWINCPGSVDASEGIPETASVYASEGTLAHALAELKVAEALGFRQTPDKDCEAIRADPLYNPEMERYTDEYAEYVMGIASRRVPNSVFVLTEQELDLSEYAGEDCKGTADCIISDGETLTVVDFKYGRNVEVSVKDNPQLQLYALGAASLLDSLYKHPREIRLAIVQPRISGETIKEHILSYVDLWYFGRAVRQAAESTRQPGAPREAGDWCMWCRAKALCSVRNAEIFAGLESDFAEPPPAPRNLTPEELGEKLNKAKAIAAYAAEAEKYVYAACMRGERIPGWKLVSAQGNRAWSDQKQAFAALTEAGIP